MKFCQNCGSKLDENLSFCTECGTSVEQEEASSAYISQTEENEPIHTEQRVSARKKKPLSKRKKILIGIGIVIGILLIGTHNWLLSYFDPVKVVQEMDRAITDNDEDLFIKHLSLNKDAIIDKEEFFEYVKTEEWKSLKSRMLTYFEVEAKKSKGFNHVIESEYYDEPFFVIKPKPILFGLYTEYDFEVRPTELTFELEEGEATFSINDQEFKTSADKKMDKVLIYPGIYTVTSTTSTQFGDFKSKDELYVEPSGTLSEALSFDGIFYYVDTGYKYGDAIIFVNGESTEQSIDELYEIGPFPESSKVKVHAEWENSDGDVLKSNTLTTDASDTFLYFEFDESNAIKANAENLDDEEAAKFVLEFRDAYENAVNYADFSEIEDLLEADSHAYKDLKKYISDLEDTFYDYNFTNNTVTDVKEVEDNVFEVKTNELFIFTNHEFETTDYDRDKTYTVVLKDDDYKIRKIDYTETKREKQ